jgi:hypothetical protein
MTGYHYICTQYSIKDAEVLEKLIVSLVMMLWSFEKWLFAGSQLSGGTGKQL